MAIKRTIYTAEAQNGKTWKLAAKDDNQARLFVTNYCRKHRIKGDVKIVNTATCADLSGRVTEIYTFEQRGAA